jgi:hypothetical protein
MFQQEIQNAKRRKELAEKNRQFNSRVNSILNNTHHQTLPTMSEVSVVKEVSNEFNDIKEQNLNEFRRFLNIATQIAQGSKSVRQTEKVKNDGNKVRQILTNISPDETPQSVFKKMSNAMILLSQMITNTADVSKSSTLSSVANSVLTKDLTKTLQKIRR